MNQRIDNVPAALIGRSEALSKGLKWFYTGKTCIYGHVSKRYVSTWHCFECNQAKRNFRPRGGWYWIRHGGARAAGNTPEYNTWLGMRSRCDNSYHIEFKRYGARGISVCERWKTFANFLADMGQRPPGHSIDRINSDGNYEPGNCRWATRIEQARNKRTSKLLTLNGETHHVLEWAERLNLSINTIRARLRYEGDVTQALRPSRRLLFGMRLRATPPWVDHDALKAVYRKAKRRRLTVDHIVPLLNPNVCGLHVPWNLQLLTKSENSRKGNKLFAPIS